LLANKGRIHLKDVGAGATIYIDEQQVPAGRLISKGDDIIVKEVEPGTRAVKIEKSGYQDWEDDIEVVGQQREEVNVVLEPE